jgi:hypothetical protein
LLNAVDRVQENFELKSPPEQLLADGLMATGENLRNRPEISSRFVKREHRPPRVRDHVKTNNASVVAARRALCFKLTVTEFGVDTPIVCSVGQAERTPILVGRRGQL